MLEVPTKICTKCGKEKVLVEMAFAYGVSTSICLDCRRKRYKKKDSNRGDAWRNNVGMNNTFIRQKHINEWLDKMENG